MPDSPLAAPRPVVHAPAPPVAASPTSWKVDTSGQQEVINGNHGTGSSFLMCIYRTAYIHKYHYVSIHIFVGTQVKKRGHMMPNAGVAKSGAPRFRSIFSISCGGNPWWCYRCYHYFCTNHWKKNITTLLRYHQNYTDPSGFGTLKTVAVFTPTASKENKTCTEQEILRMFVSPNLTIKHCEVMICRWIRALLWNCFATSCHTGLWCWQWTARKMHRRRQQPDSGLNIGDFMTFVENLRCDTCRVRSESLDQTPVAGTRFWCLDSFQIELLPVWSMSGDGRLRSKRPGSWCSVQARGKNMVIFQVQCAKDCKSAMSILKGAGHDSPHMWNAMPCRAMLFYVTDAYIS